ncbi:SAP domain-containing ribonucleoprotein isoform X2 [Pelobates fuscus]|uniref:SAP domain-containing ribonucleoprotein isoform X2 n=1 Tax=Pelobates fuscus TaxID=191477 RepID=UPI002FE484B2
MADVVEIHKLKLAELKQACLARGLEVKGNKSDLINRLQAYLDEHAEEAAEEDVLGDETEEEEQKPSDAPVKEEEEEEEEEETPSKPEEKDIDKKLVKIVAGIPQVDRLQKRAERFNVPATVDSKKVARAIRFGLPSTENKGKSTDVLTTTENDEKLKKRKERFGIVTSSASVTDDVEAKKRKRAERFGMV